MSQTRYGCVRVVFLARNHVGHRFVLITRTSHLGCSYSSSYNRQFSLLFDRGDEGFQRPTSLILVVLTSDGSHPRTDVQYKWIKLESKWYMSRHFNPACRQSKQECADFLLSDACVQYLGPESTSATRFLRPDLHCSRGGWHDSTLTTFSPWFDVPTLYGDNLRATSTQTCSIRVYMFKCSHDWRWVEQCPPSL